MAAEVRAAVQALAERKPADIHIHNAQPSVTLTQGEIRNEIHLHEQAAPVIEVKNEIHEREQPAAVINVAAPNVDVTVEAIMPDESHLTPPERARNYSVTGGVTSLSPRAPSKKTKRSCSAV